MTTNSAPTAPTVRYRKVSYLGVPARHREIKLSLGRFISVLIWDDDADPRNGGHPVGSAVIRTLKGDGRIVPGQPGALQTLAERVIPNAADADIEREVAHQMALAS